MAVAGQGVVWKGADNNYYHKTSGGTAKLDAAGAGFAILRGAQQIADPNPPKKSAPTNPKGTSRAAAAAPAAPPKVDKSNDIALQRAGLASLDQQTNAGMASIDGALNRLKGQYDTERSNNEKTYKTSADTNQNNLQKNKQTAYVNASQGRRGLFSQLSAIGALSGDGITLANRAVQKGANDDLSGAVDSYSTNQSSLDTAINTFKNDDDKRRKDAEYNAENARTNVRGDAAKSRMSFLSNISNNYAAMGDEGQAKSYAQQASALYPEIARTNVPNANISYAGAAYNAPALADYVAGADSTEVSTIPQTGLGVTIPGLFATNKKKQQQETAV